MAISLGPSGLSSNGSDYLDTVDYGTFTPAATVSNTNINSRFSTVAGSYVRVGDLCFCSMKFTGATTHSSFTATDPYMYIRSLPFSMANSVYGFRNSSPVKAVPIAILGVNSSHDTVQRYGVDQFTGKAVHDGYSNAGFVMNCSDGNDHGTKNYWPEFTGAANSLNGFFMEVSIVYQTA